VMLGEALGLSKTFGGGAVLSEALGAGPGLDLGLGLRQALCLRQALGLDENLGVLLGVVLGVVLGMGFRGLRAGPADTAGPLDRALDRALDRKLDHNRYININLWLWLHKLHGLRGLHELHGLHLLALGLDLNGNRDTLELTWQGRGVKVPDAIVVDWADPEILASGESEIVRGADVETLVSWLTVSILKPDFLLRTTHPGG
jgi:hypothetical protein